MNFCGYKITCKGYMNLRNKGKKRFIKKIKKVRKLLEEGKITVNDVKKEYSRKYRLYTNCKC